MKKQVLTLIGVLSLLLAAGSAFGQTIRVKADIPFNFVVNKATLPAGEYEVSSMGSVEGRSLLVRSEDGQAKTIVLANSASLLQPSTGTKLMFKKYGDSYFLSQIWVEGENSGHQIPVSRRESEMARDYTAQQVVIMAELR